MNSVYIVCSVMIVYLAFTIQIFYHTVKSYNNTEF